MKDRFYLAQGRIAYGLLNESLASGATKRRLKVFTSIRGDTSLVLSIGALYCAFPIRQRSKENKKMVKEEAYPSILNLAQCTSH